MAERRSGQYPASWGSTSSPAATTCAGTSEQGTYKPALAAGAPNVTCTVKDTFIVNATTYYGESIFLTGNTTELGLYDGFQSWSMSPNNYPLWQLQLPLLPNQAVSYQYVRLQSDGTTYLFETVNRTLTTGACGSPSVTVQDVWTGPTGTPPSKKY